MQSVCCLNCSEGEGQKRRGFTEITGESSVISGEYKNFQEENENCTLEEESMVKVSVSFFINQSVWTVFI